MTSVSHSRNIRFVGLVCILVLLPASLAWAGIEPTPFRTGLFGVTKGQSVRISIVNTGGVRSVINPCTRIWDAAGTLLFETDAGPMWGGVGTFVDFTPPPDDGVPPPTGDPIPGAGRVQLRVEVELVPAVQPAVPAASRLVFRPDIHLTLEVFDTATGQTVFTTPFAAVGGIDPTPFRTRRAPFRTGLLGVTAGQSIRISVLNAGDVSGVINPCWRVLDAAGALLFETDGGPLPGGVGTFVDFDPVPPTGGSATPAGFRAQVRAEVELLPAVQPADPAALLALRSDAHLTLEVFDTATGQTVYTMPFAKVGFNPQPEPPEPVR